MKLKKCFKCKQSKNELEFNWKNREKGLKNSLCKICHSEYRKWHYKNNKEKYINKAKRWNKEQTVILRNFIISHLLKHHCVDCGESSLSVLDFDHIKDKRFGISSMIRNCHSLNSVKKEINKCEVRCANCHRKKTFIERNFWKNKMGP